MSSCVPPSTGHGRPHAAHCAQPSSTRCVLYLRAPHNDARVVVASMVLHIHTSHCVAPQHSTPYSHCRCSSTPHPAYRPSDDVATASILQAHFRHPRCSVTAAQTLLLLTLKRSHNSVVLSLKRFHNSIRSSLLPLRLMTNCKSSLFEHHHSQHGYSIVHAVLMLLPPNTPLPHSSPATLPPPPHYAWSSATLCYRCLHDTAALHSANRVDDSDSNIQLLLNGESRASLQKRA